jgi:hypothetical protein
VNTNDATREPTLLDLDGQRWLEGPPGRPLLARPNDVLDAIGNAGGQVHGLLLYAQNLPPGFVDLSTGTAGALLLALQTYRVRLAVVLDLAATPHSTYFADMVREANRGRDVRFFPDRAAALAWIQQLSL